MLNDARARSVREPVSAARATISGIQWTAASWEPKLPTASKKERNESPSEASGRTATVTLPERDRRDPGCHRSGTRRARRPDRLGREHRGQGGGDHHARLPDRRDRRGGRLRERGEREPVGAEHAHAGERGPGADLRPYRPRPA